MKVRTLRAGPTKPAAASNCLSGYVSAWRWPAQSLEYWPLHLLDRLALLHHTPYIDIMSSAHLVSRTATLCTRATIHKRFAISHTSIQRRFESSAPDPQPERAPRASNVYKQFGRPFAKVFLGAMLTYQVLFWCWEKMRLDELRAEKLGA